MARKSRIVFPRPFYHVRALRGESSSLSQGIRLSKQWGNIINSKKAR